jgi:hypothetical protein
VGRLDRANPNSAEWSLVQIQKLQKLSEERQQNILLQKISEERRFTIVVQKLSETFRNFKKLSETLRKIQKISENFRRIFRKAGRASLRARQPKFGALDKMITLDSG